MPNIREEELTGFLVENQARFYRLAYSYLKNREDALDAVQAAVCRALEKQDSLRDPDAVRTWFYRILVHECTDTLRRRKKETPAPPEELGEGCYEDPPPPDSSLARRVAALPVEVGTVIKLRFYEDMPLKEISRKQRPASAGFIKLCPSPPKKHFTTKIANTDPSTGI